MEVDVRRKPDIKVVASTSPKLLQSRSFLKSIRWSADGTTIIGSSSCNKICSFPLPADLLEPRAAGPHDITAQGTVSLPEPTQAFAPSPYFSLGHPSTQSVLVACRDHPLQLFSTFPGDSPQQKDAPSCHRDHDETDLAEKPPLSPSRPSTASTSSSLRKSPPPSQPDSAHRPPLASYPFIKPETEAYLTASSLLWPAPGTHFTVGTTNLIAHFDATRPGDPPILRIPTIPSARHISKGSGVGMRGTVSALSAQPDGAMTTGLVAAGTWTRWVGLYDLSRSGSCVATWGLSSESNRGNGIVQTIWSPCGRYLLLNERRSSRLAVYDVRVTGRLLTFLSGRASPGSNQRLGCDVFPGRNDGQFEVWAGTGDGRLVAWDGVGVGDSAESDDLKRAKDGDSDDSAPSWDWQVHGQGSVVGCAAMHPSGSVVVTCAGSWEVIDDDSDESESDESESDDDHNGQQSREKRRARITHDTALKVWSISVGESA